MYAIELIVLEDGFNAIFHYETLEECLPILKEVIDKQGYKVKLWRTEGDKDA